MIRHVKEKKLGEWTGGWRDRHIFLGRFFLETYKAVNKDSMLSHKRHLGNFDIKICTGADEFTVPKTCQFCIRRNRWENMYKEGYT